MEHQEPQVLQVQQELQEFLKLQVLAEHQVQVVLQEHQEVVEEVEAHLVVLTSHIHLQQVKHIVYL